MANQVVDMDIDASQKRSANRQKRTFDGKPVTCYNCQRQGHIASNCHSPQRSIPMPRGNTSGKMGRGGRRTRAVDMEDEDNKGPTLGNQAGLHQGMAEEYSNHDNQRISQPSRPMERRNPSSRAHQPTSRYGTRDILPDR